VKVVCAPNAFKGTLTASQAAAAIARGVREALPDVDVVEVPVADGGDGTVEALVSARRGEYRFETVEGPLGDPLQARYGLIDDGRTAVVELATASGLALIPPERRDVRRASTFGFGQLLEAARRGGVGRVIAGIGGSATNDGGAGMAQAAGYLLVGEDGRDLPRGGAALERLARIEPGDYRRWPQEVKVASDVDNPLTGARGASRVYGPQKGAGPREVEELDAALAHLAEVVRRDLGVDLAAVPGAGAAGGAGFGLMAFLGAELVPGAPLVVEATGLVDELAGAALVITGEGRVDEQTVYGKAPAEVARRARRAGVPVVVIAGARGDGWEALREIGVEDVITLEEVGGAQQALNAPEGVLARAAVVACRRHSWTRR
jgi:glycerate 2-kinase